MTGLILVYTMLILAVIGAGYILVCMFKRCEKMKQGTKIRVFEGFSPAFKSGDEAILVYQDSDRDWWAYFGDDNIVSWCSPLNPDVWCVGKPERDFEVIE